VCLGADNVRSHHHCHSPLVSLQLTSRVCVSRRWQCSLSSSLPLTASFTTANELIIIGMTYSRDACQLYFKLCVVFLGVGNPVLEQVHFIEQLLFVIVQLSIGHHHLSVLVIHVSRRRHSCQRRTRLQHNTTNTLPHGHVYNMTWQTNTFTCLQHDTINTTFTCLQHHTTNKHIHMFTTSHDKDIHMFKTWHDKQTHSHVYNMTRQTQRSHVYNITRQTYCHMGTFTTWHDKQTHSHVYNMTQ